MHILVLGVHTNNFCTAIFIIYLCHIYFFVRTLEVFKRIYIALIIGLHFYYLGIAFPTAISTNNCICHFSPIWSEPDYVIKDGDVVKM